MSHDTIWNAIRADYGVHLQAIDKLRHRTEALEKALAEAEARIEALETALAARKRSHDRDIAQLELRITRLEDDLRNLN